ncbi:hypothetical protein [Massilia sp. SYSU DXS3249]
MQTRKFEHFLAQLKTLTRRQRELQAFRGVASRYLSNYLGWRWAIDGGRIGTPEGLLRAALGAGRSAVPHT